MYIYDIYTPTYIRVCVYIHTCVCVYTYVCVCRYICSEHFSVIKQNELLPFATTFMDLEITILSEVRQREKDKYCISLICGI